MDESVIEAIFLLVFYVLLPVVIIVVIQRRDAKVRRVFEASFESASFDEMPPVEELIADPEGWRARLGGELELVNAMSAPVVSDSGTTEWYSAFVVDRNGVAHDLVTSPDAEVVVTSAQWVALLLELPLKNDTFDRPPNDLGRCAHVLRKRVASARARRRRRGAALLVISAALLVAAQWYRAAERQRVDDARAELEALSRARAPTPTGDHDRDAMAKALHALSMPEEPEPDFYMAWMFLISGVALGLSGALLLFRRPRDVLSASIPEGAARGI